VAGSDIPVVSNLQGGVLMEWIMEQPWGRYFEIFSYVVTAASGLLLGASKLSKTDWDDEQAAKLVKVLGYLSLAPKKIEK